MRDFSTWDEFLQLISILVPFETAQGVPLRLFWLNEDQQDVSHTISIPAMLSCRHVTASFWGNKDLIPVFKDPLRPVTDLIGAFHKHSAAYCIQVVFGWVHVHMDEYVDSPWLNFCAKKATPNGEQIPPNLLQDKLKHICH